ncbi:hypothetical protein AT251_15735 [Enterovibrio nigricans]|nr:hypothetical protein AT251_15735 [Enterovibrio nigricans]
MGFLSSIDLKKLLSIADKYPAKQLELRQGIEQVTQAIAPPIEIAVNRWCCIKATSKRMPGA